MTHQNLNRRKVFTNYTLRQEVQGYLLKQDGILEDDLVWTLKPGELVTVWETDYNWILERTTNFLPGLNINLHFKAVIPKPERSGTSR